MSNTTELQTILKEISKNGFAIIESNEIEEDKILEKHYEVVTRLGTPSEHNKGKKDYVWKITPKNTQSTIQTFSEHNKRADLHTDSQYRIYPEKYFSLSSIRQANCGGGKSILLDSAKILTQIKEKNDKLLSHLKSPYPIAIPEIFKLDDKQFIEIPLLESGNRIRYRHDTIKKGLELNGYKRGNPKLKAFEYLTQEIQKSNKIESFVLKVGQILIIDNHRMLHGRTTFLDQKRLLYRVRFN